MEKCDMYETICKDRFDTIERHCEGFNDLLRGKNGTPGLLEELRAIKKFIKTISKIFVFIAAAAGIKVVHGTWTWIASMIG